MSYNVLIIGFGVVGNNIHKRIMGSNSNIDIYVVDKYHPIRSQPWEKSIDLAFVCVPTPYTDDNVNDISEVENAVKENAKYLKDDGVFVIKSTVLPGTTRNLRYFSDNDIIFSPEYYGSTTYNNLNNNSFNFTILGGYNDPCNRVIQIMQNFTTPDHKFVKTDFETAELVKYMENAWLATKVTFCSQFYNIAKQINGVDYEELRELFLLDPRVNPSHTFIFEDHPYWDSHCLNKDVPAIAETYNAKFLLDMISYNNSQKEEKKNGEATDQS